LKDQNGHVRRAAADALAQHPDSQNVRPLLDARQDVPAGDTHLLHAVRIALRNQLQPAGNLAKLPLDELGEADRVAIADVALGVTSPDIADFLVAHVEKYVTQDRQLAARFLRHAARFLPEARVDALAALATGTFGDDIDFQLALYRSVQEGLAQRGGAPTAGLKRWGAGLAERLLAGAAPDADTWVRRPLPGKPADAPSPWFIQTRPGADGNKGSAFWSSLPPGGEQLMGTLRSEPFAAPAKLSFFMAGHNGPPGEDNVRGNFVRVLDAETGDVIAEAMPPRNDMAQKFTLDLSKAAGRKVVFEATDGNDGSGYAWLAFGRFDTPAVKLPSVGPDVIRDRQQGAAEIAGALRLTALEKQLADLVAAEAVDAQARAAAARALAAISPDAHVKSLGAIAADPRVPPALRDGVAQALGAMNSDAGRAELVAALAAAPRQLQRTLALALAARPAGAEAFLKAVEDGKASARLLQEPTVRERLKASGAANLDQRVERLTRSLPAASEELDKLLQQRRAAIDPATASAERGAKVFTTHCAVCHKINDQGGTIAPQLDGLGKRGVERIVEDVLDPNRNVDAAFRVTILRLKGGDTAAGLLRREEGELLVLADSAGKEVSVPKAKVERRALSPLSPMPSNFHELIPAPDFNDLVAFLMGN
jgi:putative heme-binding domain-containing protein